MRGCEKETKLDGEKEDKDSIFFINQASYKKEKPEEEGRAAGGSSESKREVNGGRKTEQREKQRRGLEGESGKQKRPRREVRRASGVDGVFSIPAANLCRNRSFAVTLFFLSS